MRCSRWFLRRMVMRNGWRARARTPGGDERCPDAVAAAASVARRGRRRCRSHRVMGGEVGGARTRRGRAQGEWMPWDERRLDVRAGVVRRVRTLRSARSARDSAGREGGAEEGDLRADRGVNVPDHHRGLASSHAIVCRRCGGPRDDISGIRAPAARGKLKSAGSRVRCGLSARRRRPPPESSGRGRRETVVRQMTGDGLAFEPDAVEDGAGSSSATHSSSSARNVCQTA